VRSVVVLATFKSTKKGQQDAASCCWTGQDMFCMPMCSKGMKEVRLQAHTCL
jgi:hypothetical protein